MASPFLTANKPTISKVQSGVTQGSGITLMAPGLTAGNYNIITNPVKTSSGKIIDAADTQTISYSSSMKKAAEDLAKNGNIIEKAAAQYYLFMDDPTKIGSAKYYENKLKKLGLDVTTASDSGNAVKDFAVDVVKSFVGSPSNLGRTLAAGGLGATLLTKEDNKINTLKGGAKNAVSATIDTAIESPGMIVGGTLAGLAGAKGIGVLTKKPSVPAKIKTSDFKQTKPSGSTKTIDAEFTVKSGSQYKFKNKSASKGKSIRDDKRQSTTPKNSSEKLAGDLKKMMGQDRAKAIGTKLELESRRQPKKPVIRNFKTNTALITAKEARTPKNNSRRERARVRLVVEVQKQSGALFQDMKLRHDVIPKRISTEKGLITAVDARKPRNRTDAERRRVQKVREAQRKSGAAKISASTLLDWQRGGRRRKTTSTRKNSNALSTNVSKNKGSSTKPTSTRRPRAYETKVKRRESINLDPNNPDYQLVLTKSVPRYAAGAKRTTILKGEKKFLTKDGSERIPYDIKLEPISGWKDVKVKKSIEKARQPKQKQTIEEIREKQRLLSINKRDIPQIISRSDSPNYWFENFSVDSFVKTTTRNSPKKSNGSTAGKKQQQQTTRTTADGKPIKTNSKGESYVEVDNGNGTKAFVRVKTTSEPSTTKRSGSGAGAKSKAQAEKPKGKVNQTQKEKAKTVINRGKQTKVTRERSTKTAESRVIKTTKTKKGRVVMLLVNPQYQGNKNQVLISEAGGGTVVNPPIVVPDNIIITKPDSDTTGDEKKTTKTLTITKPTTKGKNQQINKTKKKTQTPKTRTKKKTPVRLKEEKKKKKKVVKKAKDESALRLETVNQFGWLGLDKKPAAKPKRIKK